MIKSNMVTDPKYKPVNNKVITTSTIPFAACGNLSVFDARIIHEIIN